MLMESKKSKNKRQAFPLVTAKEGEWVRITNILGRKSVVKRLIVMGLTEDTKVHVLQKQKRTGVVIVCGEMRLALGADIANNIMVDLT